MYKGIQAYTIRDYLKDKAQFEESLRKVKAIGYDSVQLGTPAYMSAQEVKALLDEIGLHSCTANASFEKLSTDAAAIAAAITEAKILGTHWVAIGTLPVEFRDSRDGFERFAESVNRVAAELKKEGCGIIYHPHALEFFSLGGGTHGMDILFNETDPSCVYFSLDTHWLASGGVNPVDWIYKAKGRMPLIHFKDYAIGSGAQTIESVSKLFAEVGEGNLDWNAIVKACHETGIQYAIVEQDSCKGNPFDSLKVSFDHMLQFNV